MAASGLSSIGNDLSTLNLPNSSPMCPNSLIGAVRLAPIKLVSSPIVRRTVASRFSVNASSVPSTAAELNIKSILTKSVNEQKTGSSGLRKKFFPTRELLGKLDPVDFKDGVLVLGGDGRYFNRDAAQIIIKIAAGNDIGKILVGRRVACR